jgi:uncharacterized membrane protein YczE
MRCIGGLALFGTGISLVIAADWGLAPWDVFHQGLSRRTGIPIGSVIMLVGAALMLLWWPLRQRPGWGTVLNTVEIGLVVNVLEPRLGTFDSPPIRALALVGGVALVGLGSGFYIGSGLGAGPRDGVMLGLERLGLSLGRARTLIEVTVFASGWALGGGIGLGTVVFALGIGPLVHRLVPRLQVVSSDSARA